MPGFDRNDLRSDEVERAAIGIADLNVTAREKSDMRVHAQVGTDNGFHVRRPAKAGRIDQTLHTAFPRGNDFDGDASNFAALGIF